VLERWTEDIPPKGSKRCVPHCGMRSGRNPIVGRFASSRRGAWEFALGRRYRDECQSPRQDTDSPKRCGD
jgi:hypothetical protein